MTEQLHRHSTDSISTPDPYTTLRQMPNFTEHSEAARTATFAAQPFSGSDFEQHLKDDAYGFSTTELLPDLPDGTPQILWRGERLYLDNIDQVGLHPLTTAGNSRLGNAHGQRLSTSRDKAFALSYAVGADGVKFYDAPLPATEIPIGVIYRINNLHNHLNMSSDDEVDGFLQIKPREYTTSNDIPPTDYEPVAFLLMDDLVQFNQRSDFRQPLEVFPIDHQAYHNDPQYLPHLIAQIKERHLSLAKQRNQ